MRAVAALIAGNQADVGFGVQAAAAQYRLGFVPVCRERYYLACRADEARVARRCASCCSSASKGRRSAQRVAHSSPATRRERAGDGDRSTSLERRRRLTSR